jgi:hypothetical protein
MSCWQRCRQRLKLAPGAVAELTILANIAWPVWINYVLQYFYSVITIAIVGRVSATAIAATALAQFFATATGYAIGYGATTAADTLASQAFGARNYARVGHITQRGIAILTLFGMPVVAVWWYAGSLLQQLGQAQETTEAAEQLLRLLVAGLWPTFVLDVLDKHFQAAGFTSPPMVFSAFATLLNAAVCYGLVYHTSMGFYGAGLASSICAWAELLLVVVYFRFHGTLHRCTNRVCALCLCCICCTRTAKQYAPVSAAESATERVTRVASDTVELDLSDDEFDTTIAAAPDSVEDGLDETQRLTQPADAPSNAKAAAMNGASKPTGSAPAATATVELATSNAKQHRSRTDHDRKNGAVTTPSRPSSARATATAAHDVVSGTPSKTAGTKHQSHPAPTLSAAPTTTQAVDILAAAAMDSFPEIDVEPATPEVFVQTWAGWDARQMFSGWGEYLRLAIPGSFNSICEWGMAEGQTVLAGLLPRPIPSQAAQTILISYTGLLFMGPLSISVRSR